MMQELLDTLAELNPDALLADGLEAALVGYTVNHHHPHVAVYDIDKCIDVLVERDGMTPEDADEFLSFNTSAPTSARMAPSTSSSRSHD